MFKIYKQYLFGKILLKLKDMQIQFMNEEEDYYQRQIKEEREKNKQWLNEQRLMAMNKKEVVKTIIKIIQSQ